MRGNRDDDGALEPTLDQDDDSEGSDASLLAEAMCAAYGPRALASVPPPGTVLDGKYRVERLLGQGGMGVVLEARHLFTDKRVAIKLVRSDALLDGQAAHRLAQEARAAGRINHPHVVAVYDAGTHRGQPFLVMELLEGMTLSQRLKLGPLPISEAIELMVTVMSGVAAAHACDVMHRDLKPDNVFLSKDREGHASVVKVLDFGIARALSDDAHAQQQLTGDGTRVGTPAFMAPEQLRGEPLDERVDVYGLGVMLYFLLTDRLPFVSSSPHGLTHQILETGARAPRALREEVPQALSDVVLKALAKQPQQRFPSVRAFARAIEPYGEGRVVRAKPRFTRALLLVAVLAMAAASGTWLLLRPLPRPARERQEAKTTPVIEHAATRAQARVEIATTADAAVSGQPAKVEVIKRKVLAPTRASTTSTTPLPDAQVEPDPPARQRAGSLTVDDFLAPAKPSTP